MKAACNPKKGKTPADFHWVSEVFKALGNPNRLLIVDALGRGEKCVAELTTLVAVLALFTVWLRTLLVLVA